MTIKIFTNNFKITIVNFTNKMKIVEEELDETEYWLGMIGDMEFLPNDRLKDLKKEVHELLSIIVKSLKTAKTNQSLKSSIR